MMLRLVPPDEHCGLALEDLPLGPWAGAEVTAYATKTGTKWHADTTCASLRSRSRSTSFRQPTTGTLRDLNLPADLHCAPAGSLGNYVDAANRLVRFADATDAAQAAIDNGDLPLGILPTAYWNDEDFDAPAYQPVAEVVNTERARRAAVVEQTRAQLSPSGEIMAQIAIVSWMRAGRTAGQHQPHYAYLLESSVELFDSSGLSFPLGARHYLNDRLSSWLDRVLDGQSMTNATTSLVEDELERYGRAAAVGADQSVNELISDVFGRLGARWQTTIEAMAAAHPGAILALFHGWDTAFDRHARDTFVDIGPSARIEYGNTSWIAAIVPAAARLQLSERRHGLCGLVLLENEDTWRVDSDACVTILRNLASSLGNPRAAEQATAGRDSKPAFRERGVDEHTIEGLPGFGAGIHDRGVSVADVLPHVKRALRTRR